MTQPRPPRDWVLMQSAMNWMARSTCSRAQVGTVLSREGRILASGYNGAPTGMEHCNHSCDCPDRPRVVHRITCSSQQPCTRAIHAEANAIIHAAKYGVGIMGAELHTTLAPCLNCAGMIINAGIARVVYLEAYRDESGLRLIESAGLEVVRYPYA